MKKLLVLVVLSCLAVLGATAAVFTPAPGAQPVAKVVAATADPQSFINQGKYYLQSHNILAARDQFAQAVAAAPDHQEANLLLGMTRVFAVLEQGQSNSSAGLDSVREIFELSGFSFQSFGLYDMKGTGPDGISSGAPRTGAILDFVKAKVLPEVDGALGNLAKVTDPSFSSSIAPAAIATSGDNIAVDYADALVIKALLNAVKCNLNLLMVYGLDLSIPDISAAPDQLLTYKRIFANDASLLTAKDPARLTTARAALIGFIDTYSMAVPLLQGRAGAGHHLFVVDALVGNEPVSATAQDLNDIADVLAEIKASLNGPQLYSFITSDDRDRTVDLSKLFNAASPINIRAALGNCSTGQMPAAGTIGGLFPLGLTNYQRVVAENSGDLLGVVCSGWEKPKVEANPDYVHLEDSPYYVTGPQAVTIANRGTATLHTSSIALSGTDSGAFTLSAGTCASLAPVIAAGASCAVTIDLKRPITGSGFRSVALNIASDDSALPLSTVSINGYLSPSAGGSISGIARDSRTGEGVPGQVTLYDSVTNTWLASQSTNETGGYTLRSLNAGSYKLSFVPSHYPGQDAYPTKWYNGNSSLGSAETVTLADGGQKTGIDFNLAPTPVTLSWGGVWHRTQADGSQYDVLDVGINTPATSLGAMTVKVDGPNGFSYSFTELDKIPYINGRFSLYKPYPAGTPLAAGVYTFTLTDANGNVSYRVGSRPAVPRSLPRVDSATIKYQRKADGTYRFSWAPVNDSRTHYYRLRIAANDAASTPVYLSTRNATAFVDVPQPTGSANPLTDGKAYKLRVEVMDAPSVDLTTTRSDSSFVNFTPQPGDYNASRLLVNYAVLNNRTDSDGAVSSEAVLGVNTPAAVSSVDLRNASGSVIYTFQAADRSNQDFYKKFTTPLAAGSYTLHFTANGLDHFAPVTLAAPVAYPIPNGATMKAEDQGNGFIRFSWANVDHTGPLYYRVSVFDKITGPAVNGATATSARQNVAYADIAKTALGDLSTKQWRVEVFDSGHISTIRNRVNGAYIDLSPVPYDSSRPVVNSWRVRSMTSPSGTTRSQVLVNAAAPQGVLSEIRVTGPNGYSRDLLSQGRYLAVYGAYALEESGLPAAGLYTITAKDNSGRSATRYIYQPAAHAVPAVDFRTFRRNLEPNGDTRISWAPVQSDVPIWYQLALFNNSDANGDGLLDAAVSTPMAYTDINYDGGGDQVSVYPLASVTIPAATQLPAAPLFRVSALDGTQSFANLGGSQSLVTGTVHNASQSAMVKAEPSIGFNYASLTNNDGDDFASNTDTNDGNPAVYPYSGGNNALPLSVKSSTPANGTSGVPSDTGICAVFNKAIDQRTLAGNFTLSNAVTATLRYTPFTACLIPAAPLAEGTTFTATIGQAVKDEAGNTLGAPFSWSFTTAANSWPLTVQRAGSGSGSVNSNPSGIACVTGSSAGCSASFAAESPVTLTASAAANSAFGGWSGACTGTGTCQVTMDAAKSVTATFSANPAKLRIDGSATSYYSLGGTLDAIGTAGKTVRAKADTFLENVIMTSPVMILFKGGFTDGAFSQRSAGSFTVLDGSLKIRQGGLKVERLLLR